uniref:Cytochrome c553 n=1 Tax=Dipterocladia arabiensis TaxID=2007176 RepID=A0A1Z1M037_9FLOR|nr:cytochrome c553 [Dipterocladia arabiensis]ARW59297.1 cytochrome c553 [Dipterocladia arabiensis]
MIIYLFKILVLFQMIFVFNTQTVQAAEIDLNAGEEVFSSNCAVCHQGGQNVLQADKTLEKNVLEGNEMYNVGAITKQVRNGKNQMPAFPTLTDEDVANVANYVLNQSSIGW